MSKVRVSTQKDATAIAKQLVEEMGFDNGCCFTATEKQMESLVKAVDFMLETGFRFSEDNILSLTADEESEVKEKFGSISGYAELDKTLSEIFDNPS